MTSFPEPGMCACGKALHYVDQGAFRYVERMNRVLGANVPVWWHGVGYLVPRHYIALHGLKAVELPGSGFTSVTRQEVEMWGRDFEGLGRAN